MNDRVILDISLTALALLILLAIKRPKWIDKAIDEHDEQAYWDGNGPPKDEEKK